MNQYSISAVNYSTSESSTFLAVTISQALNDKTWTVSIILSGKDAETLWANWGNMTEQQIIKQLLG